ncbi:polysaccharide export outer membrane protein [Sporomusaceae bacterium BoRhaA]|uniref:polysaccharide biosynthesis/export family protein n=1 Tax=Pelorhabdus rhamnosifermentans TaxID=2772457 RepID=UPI0028AD771F|nr:polysaccharide biosynthesis/export family protein [Pelorhabdus rhamnosifermentans]MBU2699061.1 polysaccharide export outer membrane protein [Pelorhabdus rhamnosifermentans]
MKKVRIFTVFLTCLMSFLVTKDLLAAEYQFSPGDVVTVSVWGYDDQFQGKNASAIAGNELVIRPDGRMSFPLVGEIQASGLTIAELTNRITAGLSEYIVNPKVSVNVVKFHTIRLYVLGEVAKPGMYEVEKQHNILDAIGMAGGQTKDAAKKKVMIIRSGQTDQPITVNLLKLLKDGDMSQNQVLNDGDVVYLSSNGRLDIARDILPYLSGLYYATHLHD